MHCLSSLRLSRALRSFGAVGASLLLAGLAQAQIVYLQATLNAAQEVPPTTSTGTGLGCFSFDPSTNTLSFNITYTGLSSAETAAHFHLGNVGVNGGVVFGLPLGTPKIGNWVMTASQVTALLANGIYANIHSTVFPGGEIRGQVMVVAQPTPFGFGDGSSGACPCGNNGTIGRGCDNSSATGGAQLTSTGAPSLACDSLVLTSSGELPTVLSIFLQGTTQIAPSTFGDGLRFVGGSLKRLYVHNATGGVVSAPLAGEPSVSARSAALGDVITAGSNRYYQTYYRDPVLGFCPSPPGGSFNVSSGLIANWNQ